MPVTLKLGREETPMMEPALETLINEAHELSVELDAVKKKLDERKKEIIEAAELRLPDGTETLTFLTAEVEAKLTFGKTRTVEEENVPKLKKELHDLFHYYVELKESYKPKKNFFAYAEDKPKLLKLITEKPSAPRLKLVLLPPEEKES